MPTTAITLAELEGEEGSVLLRRMVRGFIVSVDRDVRAGAGRRYWRTLGNGFIPYFSVGLVEGSDFHGEVLVGAPGLPPEAVALSEEDEDDPAAIVVHDTTERTREIRTAIESRYRPSAERISLPIGWVTSSKTFEYVRGRPGAPADFDAAVAEWRELATDEDAEFDTEVDIDASTLSPTVTWGTNPGMVTEVADLKRRAS